MDELSFQKMKRFPPVGIFTQPDGVFLNRILVERVCLTDFVAPAMLGVGVAENDEEMFIRMLTQDAICGMIAMAWTMMCCGDADAAAEAPPRLTSSLSFTHE